MSALVWLVALAAAAYGAARFAAGYPAPPGRLAVLSRREHAFLAEAAETLFPRGGAVEPSGLDAGVPGHVDRYLAANPPRNRLLMRLLFALMEHATLLFPAPAPRGWRRFSSLSREQQAAVLEGWRRSRLFPRRLVFTSLRAILTMAYFGDPAVLRALGLAPRALPRVVSELDVGLPPIGRPRSEVRATPGGATPPSDGRSAVEFPLHPDYAGTPR
jgi:hypothetical protein